MVRYKMYVYVCRFGYPVYPERNLGIPPVSGPVSFAGFSPSRSELNVSNNSNEMNNSYVSHGPPSSILSQNSRYSMQAFSEGDLGAIRSKRTWKKKLVDFAKAF